MNVVEMSSNGRIVLPKEIRDRHGYDEGSAFAVIDRQDGSLLLRPVTAKPKLSLAEHLRRLKGLEIPEMHFHCPPRV